MGVVASDYRHASYRQIFHSPHNLLYVAFAFKLRFLYSAFVFEFGFSCRCWSSSSGIRSRDVQTAMRRCRELEYCNQFQRLSLQDWSEDSGENPKESRPRSISGTNSGTMRFSRSLRLQSPMNLVEKSEGPILRIRKTRNPTRRKKVLARRKNLKVQNSKAPRIDRQPCIHEDLPLDILVRVLCYLNHDELKPAFRVCKKFREAAYVARQCHFDFTTPEPKRLDGFARVVLKSSETCPPCSSGLMTPVTPNAPKHNWRNQKSRLSVEDMRQITAILFPFPDKVDGLSKISTRSCLRSGVAHRVLFSENDLCEE